MFPINILCDPKCQCSLLVICEKKLLFLCLLKSLIWSWLCRIIIIVIIIINFFLEGSLISAKACSA